MQACVVHMAAIDVTFNSMERDTAHMEILMAQMAEQPGSIISIKQDLVFFKHEVSKKFFAANGYCKALGTDPLLHVTTAGRPGRADFAHD